MSVLSPAPKLDADDGPPAPGAASAAMDLGDLNEDLEELANPDPIRAVVVRDTRQSREPETPDIGEAPVEDDLFLNPPKEVSGKGKVKAGVSAREALTPALERKSRSKPRQKPRPAHAMGASRLKARQAKSAWQDVMSSPAAPAVDPVAALTPYMERQPRQRYRMPLKPKVYTQPKPRGRRGRLGGAKSKPAAKPKSKVKAGKPRVAMQTRIRERARMPGATPGLNPEHGRVTVNMIEFMDKKRRKIMMSSLSPERPERRGMIPRVKLQLVSSGYVK
uniref:Uncharacterized protein n=1 Tax=Phaeomonas parva TaxID=124430 RepID=A0A7S1XY43_9STRA